MSYDYFYGQSGELFSYFRIPKALFQDHRFRQLSTDARTLYGILLDRMSLSAKNGWLDEQGRVYIIINLLLEVRGNLRTEKQEMLSTIDRFLALPTNEKLLFTVGRRLNIFFLLDDLKKPELHQEAEKNLQQILSKNPDVDFAALCNYVRQSQI